MKDQSSIPLDMIRDQNLQDAEKDTAPIMKTPITEISEVDDIEDVDVKSQDLEIRDLEGTISPISGGTSADMNKVEDDTPDTAEPSSANKPEARPAWTTKSANGNHGNHAKSANGNHVKTSPKPSEAKNEKIGKLRKKMKQMLSTPNSAEQEEMKVMKKLQKSA